jgi:hypothetical protein
MLSALRTGAALIGAALFIYGLSGFLETNNRADILRDLGEPY